MMAARTAGLVTCEKALMSRSPSTGLAGSSGPPVLSKLVISPSPLWIVRRKCVEGSRAQTLSLMVLHAAYATLILQATLADKPCGALKVLGVQSFQQFGPKNVLSVEN
jgi:hypothetical protein